MLVTGRNSIDLVKAEWTLIVQINPPMLPPGYYDKIEAIQHAMNESLHSKHISQDDFLSWSERLNYLKGEAAKPGVDGLARHLHRSRRGLLDFVGVAASSLFGVATSSDISELKTLVRSSQQNTNSLIHRTNKLTTHISHAFEEINVNRDRLNDVSKSVNTIQSTINELIDFQDHSKRQWRQVMFTLHYSKIVDVLTQIMNTFHLNRLQYLRQKASLELGRLTEELFPPSKLLDIAEHLSNGLRLIQPYQWYYANIDVVPIWSHDVMAYVAVLPIIGSGVYTEYHLFSWAMPLRAPGHFLQMELSANHIGLDTRHGWYFQPTKCVGMQPKVCFGDALMKKTHIACITSILLNTTNADCNVKLTATNDSSSKLKELIPGEFILQTFGETIQKHCPGQLTQSQILLNGIYLLKPGECELSGNGWRVSTIKSFLNHVSLAAKRIVMPMVNVPQLLNDSRIISHLNATPTHALHKIKYVRLEPLNDIKVIEGSSSRLVSDIFTYLTFALVMTGICLYCIYTLMNYFKIYQKCRKHVFKKEAKNDIEAHELEEFDSSKVLSKDNSFIPKFECIN